MKAAVDQLPGEQQARYIVGDGSSDHWLLRDSIDLSVEVEGAKGPFTVVDLPGFHQPDRGRNAEQIRKQIRDFIVEKIEPSNTVILSLVKAEQAVAAGTTNLSSAAVLVDQVDPTRSRTLPIYSMADRVQNTADLPKLLEDVARKANKYGCVLVAVKPQGEADTTLDYGNLVDREAAALEKYRHAPEGNQEEDQHKWNKAFKYFEENNGGLGVPFLMKKLEKLQADMVKQQLPQVIGQIKRERFRLIQELSTYDDLPKTTEAAQWKIRELLGKAADRFKSSCNNTALREYGDDMSHTMLERIRKMAEDYNKKQVCDVQIGTATY
eukprot:GHUV01017994.1.p1 GENE.GHUV01017994.1~~GHUV01017994.1.p1  ORF type:complete len:324 (+),score=97.13 GHUV01017994.1:1032-2003(+)